MAATQIKKIAWWHESIVDWELQNPDRTMGDCARALNVTEPWLSIIRNSDIFRAYSERRRAIHSRAVSRSIVDQVESVAKLSLDVLEERLAKERETVGLGVVNNACSMTLKALGFGIAKDSRDSNTQVTVVIGQASPELLQRARDKMKIINQPPELLPPLEENDNHNELERSVPTTA